MEHSDGSGSRHDDDPGHFPSSGPSSDQDGGPELRRHLAASAASEGSAAPSPDRGDRTGTPLGLDPEGEPTIWAIFRNKRLVHIGIYPTEKDCWIVFTGWGDEQDIKFYLDSGYRAYEIILKELPDADVGNLTDPNPGTPENGDSSEAPGGTGP